MFLSSIRANLRPSSNIHLPYNIPEGKFVFETDIKIFLESARSLASWQKQTCWLCLAGCRTTFRRKTKGRKTHSVKEFHSSGNLFYFQELMYYTVLTDRTDIRNRNPVSYMQLYRDYYWGRYFSFSFSVISIFPFFIYSSVLFLSVGFSL
jgi:hypothetical protein